MFSVERYAPERASQWDRFALTAKNGLFLFQRGYMDYHADRFPDHSLMLYRDGDLFGLLPGCVREKSYASHAGLTFGGVLSDARMKTPHMLKAFDAILAYLRAEGFAELIYKAVPHIYHRVPAGEDRYALFRNGATLARCEVTSTIRRADALSYSERRRRGIKKSQKLGLRSETSKNFPEYFALIGAVLAEKYGATSTHTAQEMTLLAERFPDNIRLWVVRDAANRLLAGVIMYAGDCVAHAQYIAASPEGREQGALDALFDHLITQAYASVPYFDFGISTEEGGRVLNEGLVAQKEEFGARAVAHETYRILL